MSGWHWCGRHRRRESGRRECGHPELELVARPPVLAVEWCPSCASKDLTLRGPENA